MEQIQIISRDAIPSIQSIEQDGAQHLLGELRDFRWNDQLRNFMPSAARFSVSWVCLQHGEVLQAHVHPIQSMMIFYAGSGEMLGDLERPVAKDDVVVVPAGAHHGFVGGPDGLYALSIQFGEGLYTKPEQPRVLFTEAEHSLAELKDYNRKRLEEFVRRPIFELLKDGTLENPRKRAAYLEALQIWVDGNQTLLYSRQASCFDPTYQQMFLKHMHEEMGHDALHKERTDGTSANDAKRRDPTLDAITNWFAYQMYVLDNAEKTAIIHLVIENASSAYHRLARPALAKHVSNHYFDLHVEADDEHARMGEELLRNESPRTYTRLRQIVGEAWDMIGAMTDRVAELTRQA